MSLYLVMKKRIVAAAALVSGDKAKRNIKRKARSNHRCMKINFSYILKSREYEYEKERNCFNW
jgi:hypothetical protein